MIRHSERPKPFAGPRRSDLAYASPRPITAVAIGFADKEWPACRYHIASTEQTHSSGVAHADTAEAAVLDVIRQVLADSAGTDRVRGTATDVTAFTTVAFTAGTATGVIGSRLSVLPEEKSSERRSQSRQERGGEASDWPAASLPSALPRIPTRSGRPPPATSSAARVHPIHPVARAPGQTKTANFVHNVTDGTRVFLIWAIAVILAF